MRVQRGGMQHRLSAPAWQKELRPDRTFVGARRGLRAAAMSAVDLTEKLIRAPLEKIVSARARPC